MRRQYAMSRIELVIVVSIMALLLLLIVPSLGNIRSATRRTRCASNLRLQGAMLANYAARYDGLLPLINSPDCGRWLKDEPKGFTDELTAIRTANMPGGDGRPDVHREFYCPANNGQDADIQWTQTLAAGNYRVLGYNYLNERLGIRNPPPTVDNDGVT